MTLLAPLKHLTTLKFPKLSIFAVAVSAIEQLQSQTPVVSEPPAIPADVVPLPPTPNEILEQIGGKLRQIRQQQQLSIEDISARTQIQPRLVRAIEEGHIEMLPEPVYVKGMVKRYGNSLGLDGVSISQQVLTWEPEVAAFDPTTKLQTTTFHPQIRVNPIYFYLGYTLAILVLSVATSNFFNNALAPKVTTPAIVAPKPRAATVKPAAQLPDIPVGITVKSPTWAQIGIDGTTKFTGNLNAGMQLKWLAKKQITINTNNAGGLVISQNSQPPKPLGKFGQKQSITIKVGK
ncbi:RodZ domain-containing protein [Chamaesiphon sp. VAR_48_metabat_403]|uniref:helix-turn-helix domain-containing protein n=1 Tax=Chamaesiphon sp. VAR_48_metabat_403 TaxID=2964700 RepID=UPI00286E5D52|nr:RodZ domain-containing protein [Chamaesiphon sp. VAR_48_metabat_403]